MEERRRGEVLRRTKKQIPKQSRIARTGVHCPLLASMGEAQSRPSSEETSPLPAPPPIRLAASTSGPAAGLGGSGGDGAGVENVNATGGNATNEDKTDERSGGYDAKDAGKDALLWEEVPIKKNDSGEEEITDEEAEEDEEVGHRKNGEGIHLNNKNDNPDLRDLADQIQLRSNPEFSPNDGSILKQDTHWTQEQRALNMTGVTVPASYASAHTEEGNPREGNSQRLTTAMAIPPQLEVTGISGKAIMSVNSSSTGSNFSAEGSPLSLNGDRLINTEKWTSIHVLSNDNGSTPTNAVYTTKYTAWSFLPRSFLLQYRRAGNIFFTIIVFIMLLGTYTDLFDSPQAPWGNVFILTVIFSLNMTSEFFDDRARARKDVKTNMQRAYVFDREQNEFAAKTWGSVRRGDLLRLEKNATSPADLLLLTTSDIDTEQCCYVQTANIDGETYLKKRMCKKEIIDHVENNLMATLDWIEGREIRYEPPTGSLSNFKIHVMPKTDEKQDIIACSSDNVVLRGAELRNTEWIYAVVLYTGVETKTLLATVNGRIKQSKVDRMSNQVIITVLVMLVLLLAASLLLSTYAYQPTTELWYMMYTREAAGDILPPGLALLLTYIVLYRQILPILLYAVQEGLNVLQAKYIGWDLNMFDEASGKFASCNTTSLAQEIGQVKWIFSDKTGTLTRNEMRLVAVSVNNHIYGRASNKALEELARRNLEPIDAARCGFGDALDALSSNEEHQAAEKARLQHFFTVLALCHTVLVEGTSANRPVRDSTRLLRRSSLNMHSERHSSIIGGRRMSSRGPSRRFRRMSLKPKRSKSEMIPRSLDSERLAKSAPTGAFTLATAQASSTKSVEFAQAHAEVEIDTASVISPTPSVDKRDEESLPADAEPVEFVKDEDKVPTYNAESPDEEALVLAAAALGFEFAYTEGDSTIGLRFRVPTRDTERSAYGDAAPSYEERSENVYRFLNDDSVRFEGYEVVAINPFSSDRKRMSVIYTDPNTPGKMMLYCKGADNQMLQVANPISTNFGKLREDLKLFAEAGLRTLVVAEREISQAEFDTWSEKHKEACNYNGKERKAKLDEVARSIEVNMNVLGLTAVEDRLQEGVPQTISILRAAKINIWLITGDKVETAINIGRSAELISQSSRLIMLTSDELGLNDEEDSPDGPEPRKRSSVSLLERSETDIQDTIFRAILEHTAQIQEPGLHVDTAQSSGMGFPSQGKMVYKTDSERHDNEERGMLGCFRKIYNKRKYVQSERITADPNLTLVVDGDLIHHVISKDARNPALEAAFLKLGRLCKVVIACRASPGQKAELVDLVKTGVYPSPTTLTIGDGANDVPMIEKGHVGVGISGKEGAQAANAADFTIAQFKFLAPLLLVHGRFGYIRVSKAITLTFFANLLFTFVSFYYNFICRFSGTAAFNNIQYVVFQAFIAVPTFSIGFLDRDTKSVYDTLRNPSSYDIGRLNKILHPAVVDAQILRGLVHGGRKFL